MASVPSIDILGWCGAAGGGLLAEATTRTYFEFVRLQSLTDWWHWFLLLVLSIGVILYVVWMYRKDSVELPAFTAVLLGGLRLVAFGLLLFYFFQLEKRTEKQLVRNSRVALAVDTSQSMNLPDQQAPSASTAPARIDQVVNELTNGSMLAELRTKHDVVVYRFDESEQPFQVAFLSKLGPRGEAEDAAVKREKLLENALAEATWMYGLAVTLLAVALLFGVLYLILQDESNQKPSWAVSLGILFVVCALGLVAMSSVRNPEITPLVLLNMQEVSADDFKAPESSDEKKEEKEVVIDWKDKLAAKGNMTRLGDALRFIVEKERGGTLAGIAIFSDGRSNEGVEPEVAVAIAQDAEIPIYTVGLGSDSAPRNIRVVDLDAPARVYPGDEFKIVGFLQATGGRTPDVPVTLVSSPAQGTDAEKQKEEVEGATTVALIGDGKEEGKVIPVEFKLKPKEGGKRIFRIRATPRAENDVDKKDNEKQATVQIVDRKSQILLIAGGPMRDYRFLHTLLYRIKESGQDTSTQVHVLLQSGRPGISQEAHEILQEFPQDQDDLFKYDTIVAFDPDWRKLDPLQVRNLERWVFDKAGGLIVIAGPVFTKEWSQIPSNKDPRVETLKSLYPVSFFGQIGAALSLDRFGSETAFPLAFSSEGTKAEFLQLGETSTESGELWGKFPGVFGYYAAKDAKPGATVYARFPDPQARLAGEPPIYLASQFYGSGRVLYMASAEIWRLRELEESYFERFYTKAIRWVSQGRLQRDSSRGVLLVDKDRCFKQDTVAVRANLTDAQHNPLTLAEVPANLLHPRGERTPLILKKVKDSARQGEYTAQFTAVDEGDYRVELVVPQSGGEHLLTAEVRARIPDKEIDRPQRDVVLLTTIANRSNAAYYNGMTAAVGKAGIPSLSTRLNERPQDDYPYLPGTPDKAFDQRLSFWLLVLIGGVLSLEWIIRRLSKLA